MKVSKNNQKTLDEMYQKETYYNLDRAVAIVKETAPAKFDETVDLAVNLNVDPRHAEENIRISTSLPNGTGKKVKLFNWFLLLNSKILLIFKVFNEESYLKYLLIIL